VTRWSGKLDAHRHLQQQSGQPVARGDGGRAVYDDAMGIVPIAAEAENFGDRLRVEAAPAFRR
jgi:hypothetical protein